MIRRMRVSTISTPSVSGSAPPLRLVPAPRTTYGICASAQADTTLATSDALPGRIAASGSGPSRRIPSER